MFNLYNSRIFFFLAVFSFLALTSCGDKKPQEEQTPSLPASTTPEIISTSTRNIETRYCPHIAELEKIDLKWRTKNNRWQSHDDSFAKEIDRFIGAQWIGIIVGQIICLYQGKESFDFPIALESTKSLLVPEPKDGLWKIQAKDRRGCLSASIIDCPFTVEKDNEVDIYEQIRYQPKQRKENYSRLPL